MLLKASAGGSIGTMNHVFTLQPGKKLLGSKDAHICCNKLQGKYYRPKKNKTNQKKLPLNPLNVIQGPVEYLLGVSKELPLYSTYLGRKILAQFVVF